MDGYTLIDKPHGWTSFDVVAKIRGQVKRSLQQTVPLPGQTIPKRVKVGHTGTLDPLATGLLVVLVGKYTKRATELTKLDKTYEVTMKLGEVSTTADEEGQKTSVSSLEVSQVAVEAALQKFAGDIMQTPPIYSAIKVNGVRAYKLAREGKAVQMEPRPAKVYRIKLTGYAYPFVNVTVEVSSGTYIRSLVEDIGRELATGAYMSDLRRTRVGRFDIADAVTVEQFLALSSKGGESWLGSLPG